MIRQEGDPTLGIVQEEEAWRSAMSTAPLESVASLDLHSLERERMVEDLVDQGRTPSDFFPMKSGERPIVMCYVPSVPMEPGDVYDGNEMVGFVIKSAEGTVKGQAMTQILTPDQAERIRGRIEAHIAQKAAQTPQ